MKKHLFVFKLLMMMSTFVYCNAVQTCDETGNVLSEFWVNDYEQYVLDEHCNAGHFEVAVERNEQDGDYYLYGQIFGESEVKEIDGYIQFGQTALNSLEVLLSCILGSFLTPTLPVAGCLMGGLGVLPGVYSSQDVTKITNCKELQNISLDLNGNYELINDIDCSDTKNWNDGAGFVPMGNFAGTLDGNNHTISDLYINNTKESYINNGLFSGAMYTAIIKNIKLVDVGINGGTPGGFTAALIGGINYGQVSDIHITGDITTTDGSGSAGTGGVIALNSGGKITSSSFVGAISTNIACYVGVGGLTGTNSYNPSTKSSGEIINSYADVVITNTDSSRFSVGGLTGISAGIIKNSYATGVIVSNGQMVGGLVGQASGNGAILNSYSMVDVSGARQIGGLVGDNSGNILYSYSSGSAIAGRRGAGGPTAGGLVGVNSGNILNSYATGNAVAGGGGGGPTAGGLAGINSGNILNSYATGNATAGGGGGGPAAGGLVGQNSGSITNVYSVGKVNTYGGGGSGGLVGGNKNGKVINSYYNVDTSGQHDTGKGEPKTTEEMMQEETFVNWDFTNVWTIDEGKDYPRLQWRENDLQISFMPITSSQRVDKPIAISIVANKNDFSGRVYLNSMRGEISPGYVDIVNGKWTGNIQLYSVGERNQLMVRWYDDVAKESKASTSNLFDIMDRSGQMPSNAHLQGIVTDDDGNPLVGVVVQLYTEDPIEPIKYSYSTITNDLGEYSFENIIPGKFYLEMQQDGYQDEINTIQLAADRVITEDIILYTNCDATNGKVPVLLVPGIMGSRKDRWIVDLYPRLPSESPVWYSNELVLHDPLGKVGWKDLKKKFKNEEYRERCEIFEVPYDWSLDIESIRNNYLIKWINRAKQKSRKDKVDIVAHSMGGLVTRSYLQSGKYSNDVRKFAMVGTPNKGSDLIYYIWEGGDPIKADIAADNIGMRFATYFYTNTLNYLHKKRGGSSVCTFRFGYWPTDCQNDKIYDFIHEEGRSTGQLLSIYDGALLNIDTQQKSLIKSDEENTLVRALNNLPCRNKKGCVDFEGIPYSFVPSGNVMTPDSSEVQTKLFVGENQKTVESIFVQLPEYTRKLYKDGEPIKEGVYFRSNDGDGTVLTSSAIFNDYLPPGKGLPVLEKSGEHGSLIKKFAENIVKFITGNEDLISDEIEEQEAQPQLIINIDGRIQPFLIDSYGQSIAKKWTADSMDSASLQIAGPEDGKYIISLQSPYQEDYELSVMYFNSTDYDGFWGRRAMGFYDDTLSSFSLVIDSTSIDNPIIFDRVFYGPENLQMQNVNSKTLLTWSDPTGDKNRDVYDYEIYGKYNYEPYFYLLDRTPWKNFTTNKPWTADCSYAVKSVLRNGNSTLFSNIKFNLDN